MRRGENLQPGENHPRAKLKNSDVFDIRRSYKTGEKQVWLARQYGMSQGAISKIINGINWGHLEQ